MQESYDFDVNKENVQITCSYLLFFIREFNCRLEYKKKYKFCKFYFFFCFTNYILLFFKTTKNTLVTTTR